MIVFEFKFIDNYCFANKIDS